MADVTTADGLVGDPNAVPVANSGPAGASAFKVVSSSVADNADYIGDVNVTEMTGDILKDPSTFIQDNNATLSDKVPTIDANAAGTNIDANKFQMDTDALNVAGAQGAADTAAGITRPNQAQTYQAATTFDLVSDPTNQAQAATMATNQDALVDGSGLALDMQGLGTGVNVDGSTNQTGQALNQFATQDISNVIDTSTVSGKILAQTLGEGNYIDAKSTVTGQMEILSKEFVDPVTGDPKIPTWASGLARSVSRTIAFKGINGTAATMAMTQAIMEATLPIAQSESQFYQTLTVKNLDNKQTAIINKANVMSKFELADLDTRTAVAVQNAKTFMSYDMTNLANEQQTELVNTQARVQSIMEDANTENVARRFGAESNNDITKFYDQLGAQIDQFNTGQKNTMEQFNTGELNDTFQFNANLENSREQFYQNMQFQVDSANAKWRQTVTLTENEQQFQAAATDVKNIMNLTTETLNQMWDRQDSLLDYAWKEGENQKDRETKIELAKMELYQAQMKADAERQAGKMKAIGSVVGAVGGAFAGPAATALFASDARLKDNIELRGKTPSGLGIYDWEWNEKAKEIGVQDDPNHGFIAQEVEKKRPDVVKTFKDGYKRIDMRKLV
ncbi:tail fiber domain-containing protein [Planktomarina sp.]|nr:tail fiber domain-containing protein [Planktomarina sp.]